MRRGTPEGRRLIIRCLVFGSVIGIVAAAIVVANFAAAAEYLRCNPAEPRDVRLCAHLDMVGFQFNSRAEAAFTVGPVVALLVTVFAVIFALSTSEHRRH